MYLARYFIMRHGKFLLCLKLCFIHSSISLQFVLTFIFSFANNFSEKMFPMELEGMQGRFLCSVLDTALDAYASLWHPFELETMLWSLSYHINWIQFDLHSIPWFFRNKIICVCVRLCLQLNFVCVHYIIRYKTDSDLRSVHIFRNAISSKFGNCKGGGGHC